MGPNIVSYNCACALLFAGRSLFMKLIVICNIDNGIKLSFIPPGTAPKKAGGNSFQQNANHSPF